MPEDSRVGVFKFRAFLARLSRCRVKGTREDHMWVAEALNAQQGLKTGMQAERRDSREGEIENLRHFSPFKPLSRQGYTGDHMWVPADFKRPAGLKNGNAGRA